MQTTRRATDILAALVGNLLEWYDFVLYGIFATVFAQHFFNPADAKSAFMAALGVFAVGYFMRPVGGMVLAHFADTRSRRKVLIITYALMGLVTLLMALLPTYHAIGWWASLWLILLRLVQGFAVGGEFPGSMVLLHDFADPKFPVLTVSLSVFTALGGLLLGFGVAALFSQIMSQEFLQTMGWRYAFFIGFILAVIGFMLGWRWLKGSQALKNRQVPLALLWQQHKSQLFIAAGLVLPTAVFTALTSVFLEAYLIHYLHTSLQFALTLSFVGIILQMIFLSLGAYCADRWHAAIRITAYGTVIMLATIYPLFMLMQHEHFVALAVILIIVTGSIAICCNAFFIVTIFPQSVRFSGVAAAHGIIMSIVVGLTPLLMNQLLTYLGLLAPSYIVMIAGATNLLALLHYAKASQQ